MYEKVSWSKGRNTLFNDALNTIIMAVLVIHGKDQHIHSETGNPLMTLCGLFFLTDRIIYTKVFVIPVTG